MTKSKDLVCTICGFKHATKSTDDIVILMRPANCSAIVEDRVCMGQLEWVDSK